MATPSPELANRRIFDLCACYEGVKVLHSTEHHTSIAGFVSAFDITGSMALVVRSDPECNDKPHIWRTKDVRRRVILVRVTLDV